MSRTNKSLPSAGLSSLASGGTKSRLQLNIVLLY
jgi:hypothetical protein